MELQLHPHQWSHPRPDWSAAAVSGFAAGAVLMVVELLWATLMDSAGPWRVSQLIAALVMGPDLVQASASPFSVPVAAVALVIHYAVGIAFGMVLGYLTAGFHFDTGPGVLVAFGLGVGTLLYFFSFHGVAQLFVWLQELRGWATYVAHLIFGVTASLLYWKLARRQPDHPQRRP